MTREEGSTLSRDAKETITTPAATNGPTQKQRVRVQVPGRKKGREIENKGKEGRKKKRKI